MTTQSADVIVSFT